MAETFTEEIRSLNMPGGYVVRVKETQWYDLDP